MQGSSCDINGGSATRNGRRRLVVSVHIPKCAGTSFRHILDGIYGPRLWHNYGTIFSQDQARPELIPVQTEIIHGHFLADAFDALFPGRQLITWVRHPVERLVSRYRHCLGSPDLRDDCCRALHEGKLSLRQFADLEWMRNEATRYRANKPVGDFAFVGIAEQFEESLRHYCRIFGFGNGFKIPRINVNPLRTADRYDLSPADYVYILERNAADLDWYLRAVERLASYPAPSP